MREILLTAALAGLGACSAPGAPAREVPLRQDEAAGAPAHGTAVSGLPFSGGLSFRTLDEYLAHLRSRSTFDVPYYVEVAPGVYELAGGLRPQGQPTQRFTRAQLLQKYGFRE